ncbi:MAG: TIGR01777 family oxidoreductase [Candidatus Nanopelagicales bacterium]
MGSSDTVASSLGAGAEHLTIAVTGSNGLIGSAVSADLSKKGHRVIRLVRRPPTSADEREWNPDSPQSEMLDGVAAVIHLAGHSIAGRFTTKHKDLIRSSRLEPTRLLAQAAAASGVSTFVSASAIGFYGADRGDETLTETSTPGDGFLAHVVRDWEAAALASQSEQLRVVTVRTGIVQSAHGGALAIQRPLFSAGLGGPMGSGQQWQSWIAIDDLVDIYHLALTDTRLSGPVNAVAPNPVRQREYAAVLGQVLRRPAKLPTPSFGPKLLLGKEGAREIAFASQRVVPARLLELPHQFRFGSLDEALKHVLGK